MGFDENRFINKVDEEFKCSICQDIIEDPTVSQCEHVFCKLCISEWLQKVSSCPVDRKPLIISQLCEPNRFFRNLYFKLELKCIFESIGCEKICRIDELNNHQKECKFNPISKYDCEKGCGASMRTSESINHNCVEYLKDENAKISKRVLDLESLVKGLQTLLLSSSIPTGKLSTSLAEFNSACSSSTSNLNLPLSNSPINDTSSLKAICNSDGDLVRRGKTGGGGHTGLKPSQLYYCGLRKNQCKCGKCDGRCGPFNGCPCEACLKLVRNSDGDLVWKGKSGKGGHTGLKPSQLYYCGLRKNECKCGKCDGRCGPYNGCPCIACLKFFHNEACLKFLRNSDGDLVWKGILGRGGDTGRNSSQLYYCGLKKNECRCGTCDGRCGPYKGCPCNACMNLEFQLII